MLTATVTLPTDVDFPVFVDWGDMNTEQFTAGPITHVYGIAGDYDIQLWPADYSSGPYLAENVAIA